MNLFCTQLREPFKSKKVIKLITGINNLNISNIINLSKAAQLSNVTYLDVVADTKVVTLLKSYSSLPICVSSISPIDLYNSVVAGADLIEVGNFDFCYKQGIYLTPSQILEIVKQSKFLIGNIDICVTIPYYLSLDEQIRLSQDLEFLGVNILQTESVFTNNKFDVSCRSTYSVLNKVYPSFTSLLSTHIISNYVQLPIIASSSMNNLSTSMALSLGASGVGIGSVISKQHNILNMSRYLKTMHSLINSTDSKLLSTPKRRSLLSNCYITDNVFV